MLGITVFAFSQVLDMLIKCEFLLGEFVMNSTLFTQFCPIVHFDSHADSRIKHFVNQYILKTKSTIKINKPLKQLHDTRQI